jgi:hypothetical protein
MQNRKIVLTIPDFKKETVEGKEVTLYVIKVECDGQEWELKRRYNEFDDLKKDLAKNHGGLPEMPGKTLWKVNQEDFLERRKKGLESFLQKLVIRQDMYSNELFLQFLKVYP